MAAVRAAWRLVGGLAAEVEGLAAPPLVVAAFSAAELDMAILAGITFNAWVGAFEAEVGAFEAVVEAFEAVVEAFEAAAEAYEDMLLAKIAAKLSSRRTGDEASAWAAERASSCFRVRLGFLTRPKIGLPRLFGEALL